MTERSKLIPPDSYETPAVFRVMFVTHACYLDDSNGASVASRAMMQALARRGFAVEVLSGAMLDLDRELDSGHWLRQDAPEDRGEAVVSAGSGGVRAHGSPHSRRTDRGVPITLYHGTNTRPHHPDALETAEFLELFEATYDRFRPDVLVGYGGSRIATETFARARRRGVATAFMLHNFLYTDPEPFADVDAVVVASRCLADHYRTTLGLECTVLSNLVDHERVQADEQEPKYVTFVNPSHEKGVYAFARIADELGRRRPDIPLLVVEGRGAEATLAGCGLDLRKYGNVFLMSHTSDPRRFWRVTRLCLLPSLWRENQPMVAVEALVNGIPVIGSDRGGIPEVLGAAGIILPLPDRLTPTAGLVPTPEEVAPWVEAVIRLWDDAEFYEEHCRRVSAESRRWSPEILEPLYVRFFTGLIPQRRGSRRSAPTHPRPRD